MEKFLGVPIGYDTSIPGAIAVSGKEFVYFSDDGTGAVRKQFRALTQYTNPPHAKSGGVSSQGCSLVAPDGAAFHGIAYHGDMDGWRRDIEEGARGLGMQLARIEGDRVVVSDGRKFQLSECKAIFG